MKPLLIVLAALTAALTATAQKNTVFDITDAAIFKPDKLQQYLQKKGFTGVFGSTASEKKFEFRGIKGKQQEDSAKRIFRICTASDECRFSYMTESLTEAYDLKKLLKEKGFICGNEHNHIALYQKNDITIEVTSTTKDSVTQYSFLVQKHLLPPVEDIFFAEDLLAFDSHEMLRYYFGEENLQKDLYYFSDNEVNKCSVLFPNSNKQVVFIWEDEQNNCKLRSLQIGNQLPTESSMNEDNNTGENIWQLKNGVKPGMTLYQLRMLHGSAFNFGGGKSAYTGLVLSGSRGKIDFEKESIILGCVNAGEDYFQKKEIINSDEALEAELIVYVHSIILNALPVLQKNEISKNGH